jgi:hypothetical protein
MSLLKSSVRVALARVDVLPDFIVVAQHTYLLKVAGNVLIVVVFETEEVDGIHAEAGQQQLGGEACGTAVAVHERVDDYELFVQQPV